KERFDGKVVLEVPVSAPIKDAEKVINAALALIDEK
ncbi:PTS fructose transporter subunit IIB, partial [Staphylococcus aureus]|nr:PTS fructose transporter subunit IIB [Staphylococcus aureus]